MLFHRTPEDAHDSFIMLHVHVNVKTDHVYLSTIISSKSSKMREEFILNNDKIFY